MRETLRTGPPVRRGTHSAPEAMRSAFDDFSEKSESERDLTNNDFINTRVTSRDTDTRPHADVEKKEERRSGSHDDDPFGDEGENEVKYRTLRWW